MFVSCLPEFPGRSEKSYNHTSSLAQMGQHREMDIGAQGLWGRSLSVGPHARPGKTRAAHQGEVIHVSGRDLSRNCPFMSESHFLSLFKGAETLIRGNMHSSDFVFQLEMGRPLTRHSRSEKSSQPHQQGLHQFFFKLLGF